MKRIRSWCALVLAITLVGTNAVYQLGTSLSAQEREQMTELEESSVEAAAEAAAGAVTEADPRILSAKELVEAMEEDSAEDGTEASTEDAEQVIITEVVK